MPAEHVGLDPVQLQQLHGLRVVAGGDLDRVAALAQDRDQRPEDQHVGRRGDVDPDVHSRSTTRKRTATISVSGSIVRSKKRSCASCQSCDGLEPFALVARELQVDLTCGNHPHLRHLDDRAPDAQLVIDHEAVAGVRRGLVLEDPVQACGCRLLATENRVDEPAPQVGAGVAEPELRQLRQWTSASRRGSRRACGSRSTWRSCQSVNASRPQSWRERSSLAGDVAVDQRAHRLGPEEALPPQRLRAQRLAGERLELAAQPGRGRDREAALLAAHDPAGDERRDRLAQQHLLAQAAHAVAGRQREREVRHHRVEERHASLERMRHRGAVGLHQQVVHEVDRPVDVLQPREQLGAVGLGEALAVEVDRVEAVPPAGQLRARVGREDLLPGVVALERRQVRAADEALRLVVEARAARSRSAAARPAAERDPRARRRARRAGRRRRCSSRRRARRRPRPRARPSRPRPRAARPGRSAARTSRRTARRTRRPARAGAARRRAAARARGGACRSARRPGAHRTAR